MSARRQLAATLVLTCLGFAVLGPAAAQAGFGIKGLSTTASKENGSIDTQAGSHPFQYALSFTMNQDGEGHPEGSLASVVADLPAGMVGNPLAIPRCKRADFEGLTPQCPGSTQIGVAHIHEQSLGLIVTPIYNLVPTLGAAASIGLSAANYNSFQEGTLRSGEDLAAAGRYGIQISDSTIPTALEIQDVTETIWGVPAAAAHNPERECIDPETGTHFVGCPSAAPKLPFLTLPTSCTGPLKTTVSVQALENLGVSVSKSTLSLDEEENPVGLDNCEKPPFTPTIAVQLETAAADSPSGLHVALHIPQSESPEVLASAHLKDTVVSLPAGMAINPSAGDGLGACSPTQIDLNGAGPVQCPAASKVGSVEVQTPLLDHPISGAVYLAEQGDNPFGSLIALYIAVEDPLTATVVKLAGKVEPDPLTGQLTASFPANPQVPFEDFDLTFFGGPRANLTTPSTCGTYTTTSVLTPWTAPEGADAKPSSSFQINAGPAGGGCAISEAQKPDKPTFEAGTTVPLAGSYSPFVLKLSRENGSQYLRALNVTLPPGLTGKLAGVSECSEPEIAAAQARSNPGEGAAEQASPSCPKSSEVGLVTVGAGSGAPFYVQGHAYLSGPYKGAPLSLAIITPALAGPFDLGTVVVRSALYVNETTAQITVKSDPLPTILQGVPLDVRSVAVKVDRPEFMLNPTSCEAKVLSGEAISPIGAIAPLSARFQVGGCKGLDFSPKIALKLSGGTKRNTHPALRAVLTQPSGQANFGRVSVTLPAIEFIDQNHVGNPCTRPKFAEGACPPISVLGTAKAYSPLLDKPLEGKVYFRANGGERPLPDIVVDLNGKIHFDLVGFIAAVAGRGPEESRLRTTFANPPDAPVSRVLVELNGGKQHGVFVNSQNLCRTAANQHAVVKMSAQNNKVQNLNPLIANSCPKSSKRATRHHRSGESGLRPASHLDPRAALGIG